ncbi:hypothetical protein PSN45_002186 [Yamadazyma tenuis]|uniref:Rgp1-domain-containing protein n=1 Tax=Candida tenuis (strain ATCC 10573 / BCRC 21748 / CBS 615 / JCM 9827 / NBRC 10315 / NRRL Y-1498 / VKM Y-70) TaxID=590646 RepID=G3BFQ0_CANTC|nr:Rgp1-domain-containing protein [Yamadazyma tenuis ATCC 10573]EGV60074.1 Rgp1-domain-containing protein [Yamadazyma tenuis ATCC 10573]WEJ94692.1 hypothetical protein PSN45_002186 [Yamadazyma tenuis]
MNASSQSLSGHEYVKQIDHHLDIRLEYTHQDEAGVECIVTFVNKHESTLVVNSTQHPQTPNVDLPGISEASMRLSDGSPGTTHLFVGYLQLFGYVVLNYKAELDDKTTLSNSDHAPRNSHWWVNKEYIGNFSDPDNDIYERNEKLDTVPFIYDNFQDQLVIGGRLGGINDLVIEDEKKGTPVTIDSSQRYLLQDLVYNFNTFKPPSPKDNIEEDGKVPLKTITDCIIPFFSTSQSLLFTDLSLGAFASKRFMVKFPVMPDSPPTYNANSTGLTGEQGLVSIRHSLVVGFQKLDTNNQLCPVSLYFPLPIKPERKGRDERWLQADYLQHVTIDKSWKAQIIPDSSEMKKSHSSIQQELDFNGSDKTNESKQAFLGDLDKLIEADLHNLPKMSTRERKKSINNMNESEDIQGVVPQIPTHLKKQYNFLVNNRQLCLITFSRPYYHVGEDLMFHIDLSHEDTQESTTIVGVSAHLEAHEVFHLKDNQKYTNIYGVSPSIKVNTLAPSMLNSAVEHKTGAVSSYINIPNFACSQFQSSKFMDLKYFVVFEFNLMKSDTSNTNTNGTRQSQDDEPVDPLQESQESATLLEQTEHHEQPNGHWHETDFSSHIQNYKFNNYGNEFTFRLPVVILPS